MSSSSSSAAPGSPPPATSLPTLGVEFPPDHPIARRASQLQQQRNAAAGASDAAGSVHLTPTKAADSFQAHLLEQFSTPLSVPNSPAEQARRMSINPASRRNSILAIPPIQEVPIAADHTPEAGQDPAVDLLEIEREIEEIDTIG